MSPRPGIRDVRVRDLQPGDVTAGSHQTIVSITQPLPGEADCRIVVRSRYGREYPTMWRASTRLQVLDPRPPANGSGATADDESGPGGLEQPPAASATAPPAGAARAADPPRAPRHTKIGAADGLDGAAAARGDTPPATTGGQRSTGVMPGETPPQAPRQQRQHPSDAEDWRTYDDPDPDPQLSIYDPKSMEAE